MTFTLETMLAMVATMTTGLVASDIPTQPLPTQAEAAPAPEVASTTPILLAQAPAAPKATAKPAQQKPAAKPATGGMTTEVSGLVDRMQAFYERTEDFQADFEQVYTYQVFNRTQTSSGTVVFKKPGLMRWEYLKPSKRSFVLAGNKVYAHEPEAKTLSVAAMDTSQLSASVSFLFGQGRLQDEFNISKGACSDCTGVLLLLDPKQPDPRFRQVQFEVDSRTAQVLRSIVIDPDGSRNAITFKNMKTNTGVERAHFTLKPPADTRVVDYTKQNAGQGG